ncbi:hypothetical protein F2P58_23380 [Vibrio fortis]|uniref:Uncharacterized protein n=1 Tax=Vibrio fortis TaxID=212667 RepID=A0A5N3QTH1_9VIBR|nr:hypothetical protein [Vibrio fortis]KAB0285459.1 hypothetical protein F2P58_23380 [Vibrio fortis]
MRLSLDQLMTKKNSKLQTKENGVTLGVFPSPVNGEPMELLALFRGNTKTGNMIQLSVIPVTWELEDGTAGRYAICGSCPHHKIGSCYAYDQGLFSMRTQGRKGAYKPMEMETFLERAKGSFIRFGRFGDCSMLPYETVKAIADVSGGFTGYTNQWRSKHFDARFTQLFMLSTIGEKDAEQAAKMFPNARQFQVLHQDAEYTNDINEGVIKCPSENGYTCDECLLCDGEQKGTGGVNVQIRAHGVKYKTNRINKLLKADMISVKNI